MTRTHWLLTPPSTKQAALCVSRACARIRTRGAIAALLLTAVSGVGVSSIPTAQAQAVPPTTSTSCTVGQNVTGGPGCGGPITYGPRDAAILARKQALANEYAEVRAGKVAASTFAHDWQMFITQYGGPTHAATAPLSSTPREQPIPLCGSGGCGYSGTVYMPQQSQQTNSYCGPATASEMLSARGVSVSQSTLAGYSYLQTDANGGTSWGGPPYVMPTTLNDFTNSSFYEAVDANSASPLSTYENDLQTDIKTGWPVAIAVYEESDPSAPHLAGHPGGQVIQHWVGAYGFSNYGATTLYDDSVYGVPSSVISWAPQVPSPQNTEASSDMWTMMSDGASVYHDYGWVW